MFDLVWIWPSDPTESQLLIDELPQLKQMYYWYDPRRKLQEHIHPELTPLKDLQQTIKIVKWDTILLQE